jgi:Rap1a immunity proteins
MRVLTFAALLALAGPALAVSPPEFQIRNTADLLDVCSPAPGDQYYDVAIAFCHGFGAGAYSYYMAETAPKDRFVCTPDPAPTRTQVLTAFLAWAKSHPEYMDKPAVDTLFRYLAATYPCKK